jgi:hypothetical protein
MTFSRLTAVLAAALFALSACSGSPNTSGSASLVPTEPSPVSAVAAAKQFGVGLGVYAGAVGSASGATYGWCDGVVTNPSQCTGEVAGKRKYTYAVAKTINLVNGSGKNNGSVEMKFSATQKLGKGNYLMYGNVNELVKFQRNVSGFAQIVSSAWNDTLYISSKTLKKGAPVTIGVQLALKPGTNVACDAAGNSFGEVDFYSASISPPSGSTFSISGGCVDGAFEYYLYGNAKQQGTTAVGTIATSVGASYPLYFAVSGNVIACQTQNYCVGMFAASLSGNYAFKITSITSGATYTTASGVTYK